MGQNSETTYEKVKRAIMGNKFNDLKVIMEENGLVSGSYPKEMDSDTLKLTKVILNYASIAAWKGLISNRSTHRIINYTATLINLYPLLLLITADKEFDSKDWDDIPMRIREALLNKDYRYSIGGSIMNLDETTFYKMCTFLVNEVNTLDAKYSISIISYLLKNYLIAPELLFAYMGSYLRQSNDEVVCEALLDVIKNSITPIDGNPMVLHIIRPGSEPQIEGANNEIVSMVNAIVEEKPE